MRRFIVAALIACAWTGAGSSAAQSVDIDTRIDQLFGLWADPSGPGCAVAADRNGQMMIARAYGAAHLETATAATVQTLYEAGSVSKQFTAAAIVLLAQDGRLSLDDDVRRHVPELPDYGDVITLRHLLNHTSGLRDWGAVAEMEGWPRGTRAVDHGHVLAIIVRQGSLNHAPGAEYIYSNSNYNLLAIIVERVTGDSLQAFTQARLFKPLGMDHTRWRDRHDEVVPGRAAAYARHADGRWWTDMPFENAHGNGGLLTTVGDLLIWNRALADRRLGAAFMEEMLRPGVISGGRPIAYASGLFRLNEGGRAEISHSGATGGYRAWLGRYPDSDVSVAVLCNASDAFTTRLGRQVADLLLPPRAAVTPLPLSTQEALPAGVFANERTGEPIVLKAVEGRLMLGSGGALTAAGVDRWRLGADQIVFSGQDRFDRLTQEGDSIPYARVQPSQLDASSLAAYSGRYVSDEVPAVFEIHLDGDKLQLVQAPGRVVDLTPSHGEVFTSARGVVTFQRDASGQVAALTLNNGRVRAMRFARR